MSDIFGSGLIVWVCGVVAWVLNFIWARSTWNLNRETLKLAKQVTRILESMSGAPIDEKLKEQKVG